MAFTSDWTMAARVAPLQARSRASYVLSGRGLQLGLGLFCLIAGLLQLQPLMWTMNFITGIMQPSVTGQPQPFAALLQAVITQATPYHVEANALLALVQLGLGACLLSGRWVRPALLGSVAWSLMVWVGGEGLGMLLTGQASALTGAPGAVLLYGILAVAAYPRATADDAGLLTRRQLRWVRAAATHGVPSVTSLLPHRPSPTTRAPRATQSFPLHYTLRRIQLRKDRTMPLIDEEQQRLLTLHDQLDRNRQALAYELRGTAKRLLTLSRALQDTTSPPPTASLAASLHHVQEQLRTLAVTEAEISTLQVAAG